MVIVSFPFSRRLNEITDNFSLCPLQLNRMIGRIIKDRNFASVIFDRFRGLVFIIVQKVSYTRSKEIL